MERKQFIKKSLAELEKVKADLLSLLKEEEEKEKPLAVDLQHFNIQLRAIIGRNGKIKMVSPKGFTKLQFNARKASTIRAMGHIFLEAANIAQERGTYI